MINKKRNIGHCIDFNLSLFLMEDLSCAFIRPQTSARTQPPNEVPLSAAMIVYFVYFGPRIVLRLLMLQFIVELVIITQNCFSSSLVGKQRIK